MGKPDNIDPGPRVSAPVDYPSQLIHREHADPHAAARGFVYGFIAGIIWLALVFALLG